MTNLDSIFKSRDITLPTKVRLVKAMVFPVVMYGIEESLCKGCTKCARTCPVGAISGEVKQPHKIDQAKCIKCEACLTNCPFKAIVLE